jgi:hypothetical protein
VPFPLGFTFGDVREGSVRPRKMSSVHFRALSIALSKASRLAGFIAGFADGA